MSIFFSDVQSSVGSSSIQVGSWLPRSQRDVFLIPWIICAGVSSSSPHSISGPDQDVAASYMERFCHREVCSTHQIRSLSLEISWVEIRRKETQKGCSGCRKGRKTVHSKWVFLSSFMEHAFLFRKKVYLSYYLLMD